MRSLVLYLALCCALVAQTTKVGGSGTTKVGGSGTTKVGAAGISYTIFYDTTTSQTTAWLIGDDTAGSHNFSGMKNWSDATPRKIGKVTVKLSLNTGSITGKTFVCKIWTVTGTSLNAIQATSTGVAGSNAWSSTPVDFIFPSPFTTTGSTNYSITLDMGPGDSSNFAQAFATTPQTAVGDLNQWDNTFVQTQTFNTFNFQCQMFTVP